MESGNGPFDILVGLATIIGAAVTVLAYLHARRRHALSNALAQAAAPEPPVSEAPPARADAPLTFTERARIEPPLALLADTPKFRSADLSPDGRLVAAVASGRKRARVYSGATGDLFGIGCGSATRNVVVRRTRDLEIVRIYEVDSAPGGLPTKIHWIPCDDDGLVMQCRSADLELLTYFGNVGKAEEATLLPKLADGEYVWGARRGAAAVSEKAIVVYEYV